MCRGNNHGGRRCPNDNNDGRRYRDKASKLRAAYRQIPNPANLQVTAEEEIVINYSEVHDAVAELKERIYSSDASPEADDRYVAQMIAVGEALSSHAEAEAGVSFSKIQEEYESALASGVPEVEASRARLLAFRESREKLKQAYVRELAKMRSLGGGLSRTFEDPEAANIIADTVEKHYPTEWIQYSNNGSSFSLRVSEAPAYVSEICDSGSEGAEVLDRDLSATYNFPDEASAASMAASFKEATVIHVNHGNREEYQVSVKYSPGKLYDPATDGPMMGGRPIGKQWVKEVTPLVLGTKQYQDAVSSGDHLKVSALISEPRWVKPIEKHHRRVLNVISESDPDLVNVEDKRSAVESIAYHEFGHRMEEVIPDNALPRMEEAFLRLRSGKASGQFYTEMQSEAVHGFLFHEGGFVDKYVGREYMNGKYEVFTVGVEALLGKNYGSLSGQHPIYSEEDRQHKAFTLGVLATL